MGPFTTHWDRLLGSVLVFFDAACASDHSSSPMQHFCQFPSGHSKETLVYWYIHKWVLWWSEPFILRIALQHKGLVFVTCLQKTWSWPKSCLRQPLQGFWMHYSWFRVLFPSASIINFSVNDLSHFSSLQWHEYQTYWPFLFVNAVYWKYPSTYGSLPEHVDNQFTYLIVGESTQA